MAPRKDPTQAYCNRNEQLNTVSDQLGDKKRRRECRKQQVDTLVVTRPVEGYREAVHVIRSFETGERRNMFD